MNLRSKILCMCLGCTLLALLLQTLLFSQTSSDLIYSIAREERESHLQSMQQEIYSAVKDMESVLNGIYMEDDFIQALKSGALAEELHRDFYRESRDLAENTFVMSNIVSLYLYTPSHEIISAYRKNATPRHNYQTDIYSDPEYGNAQAVMDYVESEEAVMLISSYYNTYRDRDILRFVLNLYNNSNRIYLIGYLVCDVDSKVLTSVLDRYCVDGDMYIWLQPDGDRPAVSVGELSESEASYYSTISGQIQSGGQAAVSEASRQELFQVQQHKYNLTAYSLMPKRLLAQNQKALTLNLFLIALVMIAVASILTYFVSRSVTRPLDMLMDTIQKIKEGDRNLRAQIVNKDEIGQLGRNFNEMLDQMEELRDKENQANALISQAKYQALQAQINPHFLYNTLDMMSGIAQIRGCPEVSRLSQSLSSIFRYSLNMKDPLSTVASEMKHLKNYSYVMEMRMQDHVNYIYDLDEEALACKVPRLSIQPLVENALNHGLRNKKGEKKIVIEAKLCEDILQIYVKDNGVGMDDSVLNQSLQDNDLGYVEKGSSIGLHNINARLKILYGEAYGLHIKSVIGEGTSVCMTTPRIQGESDHE